MPRPRKNNANYFSHDKGMRDDPKIKAIRQRFGSDGYAAWCMLLETLTDADNFEIEYNELEVELMSGDFGIDAERLQEIVASFRRLKLISIEGEKLFCPKLVHRMQGLLDDRERKRQWSEQKKPGNKEFATSKTELFQSETHQSKVKESKVKESIINREREAQSAADEIEKEKGEEGVKIDTTPPAPSPSDAAYAWAVANLDFLKAAKDKAAFDGKVKDQVLKFCSHYSEHDAFCNQPVRFFKNKFAAWLITARENAAKSAPRKRGERAKSASDQITREKVLEHIKTAHGALAGEITEREVSALIQCADMPAMRERCAEMIKAKINDTNFKPSTRTGDVSTLAGLVGKIGQA